MLSIHKKTKHKDTNDIRKRGGEGQRGRQDRDDANLMCYVKFVHYLVLSFCYFLWFDVLNNLSLLSALIFVALLGYDLFCYVCDILYVVLLQLSSFGIGLLLFLSLCSIFALTPVVSILFLPCLLCLSWHMHSNQTTSCCGFRGLQSSTYSIIA